MENKFGVAAKAIIHKDGKYLILRRSDKEETDPEGVDIPGGRIKFGEDILDGLKREVMEESGFEIEVLKPLRVWNFIKEDLHLVGVTYLAEHKSGDLQLSWEHSSYVWVEIEEIMDGDYPSWFKKDFALI